MIIIRSGLLAENRWSVCMSKSQRSLCVSFSGTDAGLRIYHLFVWSNLNFLHVCQWIILPTQWCLVLHPFIIIIIIIIIIIVHSLELFTSAIADGPSLKSEWQQVSSCLQDSSYYSGSSQQCCHLDGLHSSSNLQVL